MLTGFYSAKAGYGLNNPARLGMAGRNVRYHHLVE
jgi:hypothetical protein